MLCDQLAHQYRWNGVLEDRRRTHSYRDDQVGALLQTTAGGIYAVSNCAGNPLYRYVAFDHYCFVLSSLRGGERVTTGRQVPSTLFTDLELAHVGIRAFLLLL